MPRIFDNINNKLVDALCSTLRISERADFCVGYFNLRGWRHIEALMERWSGDERGRCRLMVGMQDKPEDEMRKLFSLRGEQHMDQGTIVRLKQHMAQEFRQQLLVGAPTNEDQEGLRRLSAQLRSGRLVVKLFLRHKLHAKLYLLYQSEHPVTPIIGYMGSSNLTLAGLQQQGELNIDVVDSDACQKLEQWFNERWQDRWCLDISQELADIIDESWAREEPLPPYYIYLKMAYHLSEDARTGLLEFNIPRLFRNRLFDYQVAAVKIAAHHLNRRGGVIIGDVVGLGKTLMATCLARLMQEDYGTETLIICSKNLVKMWRDYVTEYGLVAEVLSISRVIEVLPDLRRFRLVVIDESHNLRNREGKRFRAIKDYIEKNESKAILLTATPYNKTYLDMSSQLRLFLNDEDSKDMGIRPERLLSEMGEARFNVTFQCPVRSLTAFEHSPYADDWRDLMRYYLVRRTRSFIQENYARTDAETGRKYLEFANGTRSYFPERIPRTVQFVIDEQNPADPYAVLYSPEVVEAINGLHLPRYGMAEYILPKVKATESEKAILSRLSRGGKRLMGFSRTNLFKRLESGGPAFIQSLERHILRNYIYLYAIEQGLDIPLGTQDVEMLDTRSNDEDNEIVLPDTDAQEQDEDDASAEAITVVETIADAESQATTTSTISTRLPSEADYRRRAAAVYDIYAKQYRRRFKWLSPRFFNANLKRHLREDARNLLRVLERCGTWDSTRDAKLNALIDLLTRQHPNEKVLVFSQFADTVHYLTTQLKARGLTAIEGITGASADPTEQAWRFSPVSNNKRKQITPERELRILVATDVLSEGQNLQDAAIVVNFDLPWAIIRLIQRAGRVDRIGQQAENILCYSFLPADGVERLIHLRERVQQRLRENAEVVGSDEAFFEEESDGALLLDLYNEKAGILDSEDDNEVDLASQAYQIWKNATDANPKLKSIIEKLPDVVFSTRAYEGTATAPEGVLVYIRTGEGNDALTWVNRKGEQVTQSQLAILRAAACTLDTPALPRPPEQHGLVRQGIDKIIVEESVGATGRLGGPSGARRRTYDRLKTYYDRLTGPGYQQLSFLSDPELERAHMQLEQLINEVYRYPLQESAKITLNRQLRSGASDEDFVKLVLRLHEEARLCHIQEPREPGEPRLLCSLGLFASLT
jgi:SNF2 family DNA or RNA helicase